MALPKPKKLKKLKKPKKPSRKKLISTLDRVFSLWIRARDGACVVCGSKDQPNNGHLFTRRNLSTRWCELNCHQQCYPCNFRHTMDTYPYTRWFIGKYGLEAYDELHRKHRQIRKISNSELQMMIEHYRGTI
jgi:hypothetical protein